MNTDIVKWLCRAGIMSRSDAAAAVAAGRVWIDGELAGTPGAPVTDGARVALDGAPVVAVPRLVLAMHKPAGALTTHRDPFGRPTVYGLLDPALPWLAPVGRLDGDSEGLLLFTNDPHLGFALTDPGRGVHKTYHVTGKGQIGGEAVAKLSAGVMLRGQTEPTRPATVTVLERGPLTTTLEIILHEGRNRQIRRMLQVVGSRVRRLVRVQVGPVSLGSLAPGQTRMLTEQEVLALSSSLASSRGRTSA